MNYDAIETLRNNAVKVTELLINNPEDSSWLKDFCGEKIYEETKYQINDFSLKTSDDGDYSKVDFDNSITIYENLNKLPRYILTDEGFWAWFNFTIGYKASLQAMKLNEKGSTFKDHWLFTQGRRRGVFFGVMSRCYFRVDLSVDNSLKDKYEVTRFVIENPERIRNLTWRSLANSKKIVLGVLKAEMEVVKNDKIDLKQSDYEELAKHILLVGSVRLLDSYTEEEIYEISYRYLKNMI